MRSMATRTRTFASKVGSRVSMAARNAGIRAKSGLTRLYGTSQRAGTATFKAAGIELFLSDKAKDINRNASLK
nr:hypothetical protein [Candidatus Freyrarchaeum guaymaensis]